MANDEYRSTKMDYCEFTRRYGEIEMRTCREMIEFETLEVRYRADVFKLMSEAGWTREDFKRWLPAWQKARDKAEAANR